MIKYVYKLIFCILIAATCFLLVSCDTNDNPSPTQPDNNESGNETTSGYVISIESITRQDGSNVVITWNPINGFTYNIYRSASEENNYTLIGTVALSSFRDDEAFQNFSYKVEAVNATSGESIFSDAQSTGYNPKSISRVYVIMYHNFITEEDIASGVEFEEYSIKPEDFESDLIWLRDNGYTTITSDELISSLKNGTPLPEKAVIISIDDGTYGVYKNAWPLLKKYKMKADLNLICENIDITWENLNAGGTRDGESAPYCTWEELIEMNNSGDINLCSHTYGMHKYNRDVRIGAMINDGESEAEYISVITKDFDLVVSSLTGWTGKQALTLAYPYSKRNETTDRLILEHTGYDILMAGEGDRGTAANYFVDGIDFETQLRLISRPCRMEGTHISEYIEECNRQDNENN